jgi:hypothetical protein
MKLVLAVTAFSLIAAPANAATYHSASSVYAVSQSLNGLACKTVHSAAHNKTGVICIGLAVQDDRLNRLVSAVATFKSGSGKPTGVSVSRIVLYLRGGIAESGVYHRQHKGGTFYLTTRNRNLWDGHPGGPAIRARAGLLDACMYWPHGVRACTGTHWLDSRTESILP